jgi:UDP-glucose 4-epimerase
VRASWGAGFELYLRRNVLATQRLFEAAAAAGVRVVFASSSSVYGDAERYPTPEDVAPQPISPYGITKLACEQLAHAIGGGQGLDAVLLRYFTVYGPRQRPDMAFTAMLEALARGEAFRLFGDGSAARSFTYVGDAVAATIAAMQRGRSGEIYNVGGGDEATMSEAIALAEEFSGRRLEVERLGAAAGDVRRTRADVTKAETQLAWTPRTPLREGMRAQWEWAAVESRA